MDNVQRHLVCRLMNSLGFVLRFSNDDLYCFNQMDCKQKLTTSHHDIYLHEGYSIRRAPTLSPPISILIGAGDNDLTSYYSTNVCFCLCCLCCLDCLDCFPCLTDFQPYRDKRAALRSIPKPSDTLSLVNMSFGSPGGGAINTKPTP